MLYVLLEALFIDHVPIAILLLKSPFSIAYAPIAILEVAVVAAFKAFIPIATLLEPVRFA